MYDKIEEITFFSGGCHDGKVLTCSRHLFNNDDFKNLLPMRDTYNMEVNP